MPKRTPIALFALLATTAPVRADEGMWLFNAFPAERVQKAYGFTPDQAFLDHVRLSSARFSSGGSGSFVSSHGLLVTNHHIGRDCIAKLSTAEHNREAEGYLAATQGDEVPCPDLEINVVMGIDDVTSVIKQAEKPNAPQADNERARREARISLEQGCNLRTGFQCKVVTLYDGGAYHLYKYKRYEDIRLVFAPEEHIAFYGGDVANFEYPRYNLDLAFFRAYENGKPLETPHFFPVSSKPVHEGDLVFVSGNPGHTDRHLTLAQLDFLRKVSYPYQLAQLKVLEARLNEYAAKSPEAARQSQAYRFYVGNNRKRYLALLEGISSDERMNPKRASEKAFREAAGRDPHAKEWLAALEATGEAVRRYEPFFPRYMGLEGLWTRSGSVLTIARGLVRLADESVKPNEKRLPEFSEGALPSLKQQLFSTAPVYKDLTLVTLWTLLERMQTDLGATDPVVTAVLAGRTPKQAAEEMMRDTKLDDLSVRKALVEGGQKAIAESRDPLIVLMRTLDPEARAVRARYENEVESMEHDASSTLTAARFALYGATQFPDATFSLRLTYGQVKGYQEDGKKIPYYTDVAGLFQEDKAHRDVAPFELPARWKSAKGLKPTTQFNFVATLDTTGGNSGSPVINKKGELVGVIFDSNRQKIANDLVYSESQARAVNVSAAGMMEALDKVYGATGLVRELEGAGK